MAKFSEICRKGTAMLKSRAVMLRRKQLRGGNSFFQNCLKNRDRLLYAFLAIFACLFLLSLKSCHRSPDAPRLSWAPGYWIVLPGKGMARVVPFCGSRIVSPSADMGARAGSGGNGL